MSSSERRRLLGLGAALAAASALGGCGFALRRPQRPSFERLALVGLGTRSPMAAALRRALAGSVSLVEVPAAAQVVLTVEEYRREKSVVASTSAAQVREFEVRVRLRFAAATPTGRTLIAATELLREEDLSFAERAALAKQFEEDALYRDIEDDLATQVARRLAAIRLDD